ncbi:MAG: succinylglutamate desuccinylase/aspartoacylase family protein [Marivibrio sp.]|uniref:succinylglutamate desuccinylase/aspartoacylase domain-containing protein n=1 Tax=Marivibrio sp. TaxID=2039719 RepID=UPI0032EA9B14
MTETSPNRMELVPPDLTRWRGDGTPPHVHRLAAPDGPEAAGPHAVVCGLVHGNELCGGLALERLLARGFRPARGRLTLVFANPEACSRFDPARPFASRAVVEDLNRLWAPDVLAACARSPDHVRAKALRPVVDQADYLLDLHSTAGDEPPMILAGETAKSLDLARRMGAPRDILIDAGHAEGVRLRDYGPFADPARAETALLVECGQHWRAASLTTALDVIARFLAALDMLPPHDAVLPAPSPAPSQRLLRVTHAVTVETGPLTFTSPFQGGERIAEAGVVIAHDGSRAIVTPYDDCILVMPTHRAGPGQTAVRFATAEPS